MTWWFGPFKIGKTKDRVDFGEYNTSDVAYTNILSLGFLHIHWYSQER